MARSRWKLKHFSYSIWRKIFSFKVFKKFSSKKIIYERNSSIPLCFQKKLLKVHKGKNFRKLLIHKYNVGFKFGEFSYTRKPFHFPLRKRKKIRKNVKSRR